MRGALMGRILEVLRSTPVRAGFLLLALGLAIWAIAARWDEVVDALARTAPWAVGAALVLSLIYVLLTMMAWRAVLADLGSRLAPSATASVFLVSQLGKYVPGGVWNIVAAAEVGSDHDVPRRRSVSAMAVAVLLSLVGGLLLALAVVPFAPSEIADRFGWAFVALPVVVAVLMPPVLNRLLGVLLRLTRRPPLETALTWRGVGEALAWTLASWIAAGVQVWVLAVGVGMTPDVPTLLLCIGGYAMAWSVGFLVIFVPAGAGVREVILAVVLGGSLAAGEVLVVVILSRLVLTIADVALGLLGLVLGRRMRRRRSTGA